MSRLLVTIPERLSALVAKGEVVPRVAFDRWSDTALGVSASAMEQEVADLYQSLLEADRLARA
jgi:hypothetical protein